VIVKILKFIVPFLVVIVGAYGAWKLVETRPEVETQVVEKLVPTVRSLVVEPESIRLSVFSQGSVKPRTVSDLVPEVAGKVTYVSPSLVSGGFFEESEVLLRIDAIDYELAVVRSESEVAQARLRLEQERAEAAVAAQEWAELGKGEEASPLVLRKPQVAQAEAALAAAEANLQQARRNLEKTVFEAPFDGRVQQENVDIGQYIAPGQMVARLYSVDVAEVRLPLSSADLAYVNIPLSYRGDETDRTAGPEVVLTTQWAGETHTWKGRIVRTEGEIDTSTRMLYAVAEVRDPYGRSGNPNRPPLAVGMFVEAEILGNWINGAYILPRGAIRGSDTVYVIDEENRLRFRKVNVFKQEKERVIVRGGLETGEKICISPMESVVDGMQVQLAERQEVQS
jgi:RND family efflux transporter MFP subunit